MIEQFFGWLQQIGLPRLESSSALLFLLCVSQLPLLLFRKTRRWVGNAFYVVSFVCGFAFWVLCAVVTFSTLGVSWVIWGIIAVGVGVVPLAFVGMAIHKQWLSMPILLLLLVATYALRGFGIRIRRRCDRQTAEALGVAEISQ